MKAKFAGPSGQGALTFKIKMAIAKQAVEVDATATRVCTSDDYGKLIVFTLNNSVAVTLPANGAAAGSTIDMAIGAQAGTGADSCAPTISAATADTLVGPNEAKYDSVTWGSGQRIGALARFWSDGEFWHVENLGGTTMTYTG